MTSGEAPGGLGSRVGAANGRLGPEMPLNRCSKLQNAIWSSISSLSRSEPLRCSPMRCPNAGLDVLLKGCPHLSLGVGLVTRKGLLTAPKCVTAAGYHPHLINTHIYKVGEVNKRTLFIL